MSTAVDVAPSATTRLGAASVREDVVVDEDLGGATRGRPRSVEADRAIVAAAAELLEEEGFDRLTMEAIAHRAGVGKATLYRRWSNKVDLVVDVISTAFEEYPIADTGDTKQDLLLMSQRALSIIEGRVGRIMKAVTSELGRNEALAAVVRESLMEPRREALRTVVRRGMDRGDIRSDIDPDLVLDALVGALYYRSQTTDQTPTAEDAEALVDLLFRGMSTD
jgi:AcrR family transcriptional regulator